MLVCVVSVLDVFKALGNFDVSWQTEHITITLIRKASCEVLTSPVTHATTEWSPCGIHVLSGIQYSAAFMMAKKAYVTGGIAALDMRAIVTDHSAATCARACQPLFSASHYSNPSTGLGVLRIKEQ